jgi:anhydro-N-acetylmuramic acid kinase
MMSGSSLDGLDLCYAHLQETSGRWSYEIKKADCYAYSPGWIERLQKATELSARDYMVLHVEYGHYLGELVNRFLNENALAYQVQLIGSHGHTTFHMPSRKMTAQLGDGAAIAAETGINVVADLRAMDLALGGQGAPIVPIGERMLLGNYEYFLNLGGIANISANYEKRQNGTIRPNEPARDNAVIAAPITIAFDVCPANRVLNLLSNELGKEYDDKGSIARSGKLHSELISRLNGLEYYQKDFPKSLANDFGTDIIYPLIKNSGYSTADGMRTMVEHIVYQIKSSIEKLESDNNVNETGSTKQLLATGGGAFNNFLVERLSHELETKKIEVVVPDENVIKYKEALIMGLMAVLRWREENNVFSSVTGASRDSIGGAVWIGQPW